MGPLPCMSQNVTIYPSKTANLHTNMSIHGRTWQCKWLTFLLISIVLSHRFDHRYIFAYICLPASVNGSHTFHPPIYRAQHPFTHFLRRYIHPQCEWPRVEVWESQARRAGVPVISNSGLLNVWLLFVRYQFWLDCGVGVVSRRHYSDEQSITIGSASTSTSMILPTDRPHVTFIKSMLRCNGVSLIHRFWLVIHVSFILHPPCWILTHLGHLSDLSILSLAPGSPHTVLLRSDVHWFGNFWSKKIQKKSKNSKEKHFEWGIFLAVTHDWTSGHNSTVWITHTSQTFNMRALELFQHLLIHQLHWHPLSAITYPGNKRTRKTMSRNKTKCKETLDRCSTETLSSFSQNCH